MIKVKFSDAHKVDRKRNHNGGLTMEQGERRRYLIQYLIKENIDYKDLKIPTGKSDQEYLLRALMNVRMPGEVSEEFLRVQDAYLETVNFEKGITELSDLEELENGIYLWQGDITTLHCGAIVNAANSQLLGCFQPGHSCIDNAIHTFAGVQLRNKCYELMSRQGHEEPTGQAKITPAYNLPCECVIHTVGPIVRGRLTDEHKELLASCYRACLNLAEECALTSIAFCCISTGVFMFPNEAAAEIAVGTVRAWRKAHSSQMKVVFNVFKDMDKLIYQNLLGK